MVLRRAALAARPATSRKPRRADELATVNGSNPQLLGDFHDKLTLRAIPFVHSDFS